MTGEKLMGILEDNMEDMAGANMAVHCILSVLDKEREGEVVLGIGHVDWFANSFGGGTYGIDEIRYPLEKVNGQAGTLIFRPTIQEDKK